MIAGTLTLTLVNAGDSLSRGRLLFRYFMTIKLAPTRVLLLHLAVEEKSIEGAYCETPRDGIRRANGRNYCPVCQLWLSEGRPDLDPLG